MLPRLPYSLIIHGPDYQYPFVGLAASSLADIAAFMNELELQVLRRYDAALMSVRKLRSLYRSSDFLELDKILGG
jgi:hypothetical protein